MVARVSGLDVRDAETLARHAAAFASRIAPKSSGQGAAGLAPVWGPGWYGITWDRPQMWFQENGTAGHVMRSLAGKVIPMWIPDPTGALARDIKPSERRDRTRVDAGGKRQVKIFRRAARLGARKVVNGRSVPQAYPGAPGRIALRQMQANAFTSMGKIAKGNGGVRWRHPGITGRGFMRHAIEAVADAAGVPIASISTMVSPPAHAQTARR
jgi:hypothetical protein